MTDSNTSAWQRLWRKLTTLPDTKAPTSIAAPDEFIDLPAPATTKTVSPLTFSTARTADEYRRECARHVYNRYTKRIYQGVLPPMLYAIGSLELYLDTQGNIQGLNWLREPSHAPEVVQQIEDLVYEAAPFPAAPLLAETVYTDTWLWDESGRFQLHTLTEGQR
ncbi:MAG: hypothetical protein RSD57_14840 [Comamonas sp.]